MSAVTYKLTEHTGGVDAADFPAKDDTVPMPVHLSGPNEPDSLSSSPMVPQAEAPEAPRGQGLVPLFFLSPPCFVQTPYRVHVTRPVFTGPLSSREMSDLIHGRKCLIKMITLGLELGCLLS